MPTTPTNNLENTFPSSARKVVGDIDANIDMYSSGIETAHSTIVNALPEEERNLLYSEPSYSADILLELDSDHIRQEALGELKRQTDALVTSQTERSEYVQTLKPLTQELFKPVPDHTLARSIKDTYRDIEIDASHPLHDEEVVSLRDYNIACQAYYSRKNGATGDPVPGVKPDVYVRKSIAEKVVNLNQLLSSPEVTEFFGGEVEIFVDEGWRDPKLQKYLYETVIPDLIRAQLQRDGVHSTMSDEDFEARVLAERDKKIARPPQNRNDSPSPHATGAAIDFAIRYKQPTLDIAPNVNIPMAKGAAELVKATNPDDLEHTAATTHELKIARQNRRAQYTLARLAGLTLNPSEFWHASHGDQLASLVTGDIPFYGWADMEGKNEDTK